MAGYVGSYTVRLEMPWVHSLKEKRALIRPVIERLRVRFPVSAARLNGLNAHTWEEVGFVVLGSDGGWVEKMVREAASFIAAGGNYTLCEEWWSIERLEPTTTPRRGMPR